MTLTIRISSSSILKRGPLISVLLLTALVICLFPTPVSAQDAITTAIDCTDAQAAECVTAGNRSCLEGTCVGCLQGFVELPEEVLDLTEEDDVGTIITTLNMTEAGTSNGTICAPIEALTAALYEHVFTPLWESAVTTDERLEILLAAAKFVSDQNAKLGPNATYTLALNEFSADTDQEQEALRGYQVPANIDAGALILQYLVEEVLDQEVAQNGLPSRVDWVERGAVTSVKNQGRCGGCWSISVAGALEGAAAIWSNFTYLQSLSFQQLISCDKDNNGCNGGFPAAAIRYANDNWAGGMATLNDYPFSDQEGETTTECLVADKDIAVESQFGRAIVYYGSVGDTNFANRMAKMKQGLARQPVAIAVNTKCNTFKNYKSGVVTDDEECSCLPSDIEPCLDHAVLLVGYDDEHDPPYWKIKNSWGTGWGEQGYIRIAQFNPHPTHNSWGLFGVLAEGVVPLQAFNQTQEVYDQPQTIGGLEVWQFVLILVAIVVVCCCVVVCIGGMMRKKSSG